MALDKYRRDAILTALETDGRVRMRELAQLLDVSQMTIRRDLMDLEEAGLLIRVHGGAVSTSAGEPLSAGDRGILNRTAKELIAETAARLIPDDSRVILDSGTTVAEVARLLRGKNLDILTASLPAAAALADDRGTHLTLLGGRVRSQTMSAIGTDIEESISGFHADFGLLGTSGVSDDAFSNLFPADVGAQQAIIAASATTWLLADHTKMGLDEGARVARLSELSAIVTDAPMDPAGRELPPVMVAGGGQTAS